MSTTRLVRKFEAPRGRVYHALTDPQEVTKWMFPEGMKIRVHEFDLRVGGSFRISLTYDSPGQVGKTSEQTDTYQGHFVELVPDQRVVQVMEFETSDPTLQGEMTVRFELNETESGTEMLASHENVPEGVSDEDNELGWAMALDKLAKLVEG